MTAFRHPARSQRLMRTVTIGRVLGVFAAAQIGGLAVSGRERQGRKGRSLVAAIAKGLLFRLAARAPEVSLARLDRHGEGGFLGDMGGV